MNPPNILVDTMNRIYRQGMTTTSGGNLSVVMPDGTIYITPTGLDKGELRAELITCVAPSGKISGPKPSVELPFHASVFRRRPDLKAVLHAHSPALVALSVVRRLPNTRLCSAMFNLVGEVAMADYALPGSGALGENIGACFDQGYNAVLLENHGVCVGAADMSAAFRLFETLELSAAMELEALRIGTPQVYADGAAHSTPYVICDTDQTDDENEVRETLARFIRRCCTQRLMSAAIGVYSARLADGSYIINPPDIDRATIQPGRLVRANGGFHGEVYAAHPDIASITEACPTSVMAFAVTDVPFDPRTIPESYLQLRELKTLPYGSDVVAALCSRTPAVLVRGDRLVTTGATMLSAFDRLEVAEATARSVISARAAGKLVGISTAQVEEIDIAFNLI